MTSEIDCPRRYVWECLDDDCKRRETAEHQAEIKHCECGRAMMAVADARPDGA